MPKLVRIALIAALLLTLVPSMHAKRQAVQVDPLSLGIGFLNARYEWVIKPDQTLVVTGAFAGVGSAGVLMASFGTNKYFNDEALSGLYAGGSIGLVALSATDSTDTANMLGLSVGGTAGYKLYLDSSIFVDGSVNVTMPIVAQASVGGQSGTSAGIGGLATGLGIGIGYRW